MKTSELDRIFKVLSKNKGKGLSTANLARLAKANYDNVRKRVYDLTQEGYTISGKVKNGKYQYEMIS